MTDLQAVVAVVIALLGAVTASVVTLSKRARNGHSGRPIAPAAATTALPPPASPQWSAPDQTGPYRISPPPLDERLVHRLAEHETWQEFFCDRLEKLEQRAEQHGRAITACEVQVKAARDDIENAGELILRRLERIEDRLNHPQQQPPRPGPRGGRPGPTG